MMRVGRISGQVVMLDGTEFSGNIRLSFYRRNENVAANTGRRIVAVKRESGFSTTGMTGAATLTAKFMTCPCAGFPNHPQFARGCALHV